MLELVKTSLRVTTDAYDTELNTLIKAALIDLGLAGITNEVLAEASTDPLINLAVQLFCKRYFSRTIAEEQEALGDAYFSIKSLLRSSTGYTMWEA